MDDLAHLLFRSTGDERGAYLLRYAVVIALACFAGILAFTTVGQEFVERVWALGDKIARA